MCANITIIMYHLHFHACTAIIFYCRCCSIDTVRYTVVVVVVHVYCRVYHTPVNLFRNLIPYTLLDFSSGFLLFSLLPPRFCMAKSSMARSLSMLLFMIHVVTCALMANRYYWIKRKSQYYVDWWVLLSVDLLGCVCTKLETFNPQLNFKPSHLPKKWWWIF